MMHESYIIHMSLKFYKIYPPSIFYHAPIPPYTSIYSVEGGTYRNKGILFSLFLFYETSDFWDLS